MRVQKLDLVDDRIVTTSDILQIGPIGEKLPVPGSENDVQPVVIAFDIGDMDNAGNWPRVRVRFDAKNQECSLTTVTVQKAIDRYGWLAARFQHYLRFSSA